MAAANPAAAPQRVCPHCATVSQTAGDSCPWCHRRFRRSNAGLLAAIALLLALQTALLVGGLALVGQQVADRVDDELSTQVRSVRSEVRRSGDQIETRVTRQLDSRLP